MALSHGWQLVHAPGTPNKMLKDFVRPALCAVPGSLAARLGSCRVSVLPELSEKNASSQWSSGEAGLEIAVATAETEPHDVAMEVLLCLGQVLWEKARAEELEAYLRLLDGELAAGVSGEIDEESLRQKRLLLSGSISARSRRRLLPYVRASFAATVAEYVHCLWHDVTVRSGSEHLPARFLRRRLETLASRI
jgi:hypothetical protein